MQTIDAGLVRALRNYARRLDAGALGKECEELQQRQPWLHGLFGRELAAYPAPVQAFGFEVLAVVWRMFESASDGPLRQVSTGLTEDVFEHTTRLLFNLDDADPRFAEAVLDARRSRQPHVMEYVEGRCVDYGQGPGEEALSNGELGMLFALLRAAVDAMHLSGTARGEPPARTGSL